MKFFKLKYSWQREYPKDIGLFVILFTLMSELFHIHILLSKVTYLLYLQCIKQR